MSTINQLALNSNNSLLLIFQSTHDQQEQEQLILKFLKQTYNLSTQLNTNLIWINQDGAGVKIKAIRELITQTNYSSYNQDRQFFIILNAHQSSIPAQNALLKILEEPPTHSQIILTTSQPERLLPTIHSRCLTINLSQDNQQIRSHDLATQSATVQQLADTILDPKFDLLQAIELASQYQKRETAQEILVSLILYLHQQLDAKQSVINYNLQKLATVINYLLTAYQDVLNNLNVRLALEHWFFKIVALHNPPKK